MELFKLLGVISIKNDEANKALEETGQKGEKTESKLGKAFGAIGKGAVAVGKTIMTGLAAGGAAMAGLTIKAMNLGGELEQNMGGSEAVFAEYATKMQVIAKEAFGNMGLSTSDFLATANKMGALFQGAGFSIQESSDISAKAMQRAADVASIMGIDTAAAMDAIAGAAKGNFTMMDNLGVAMNDTTLNAYAMEKGIKKTTQEMTNQEKIGLAMEMFLDKTAYAAGNYAKENETLAGSLGTAKAALTNFLDGSGDVESLVTAFSNAADVIIRNIQELAPRLISGLTEIVGEVIPMIGPLCQQILPVIVEGAISLINGLVDAFPDLVNTLATDVLPAVLDGFMMILRGLLESAPTLIESLFTDVLPELLYGLTGVVDVLLTHLPEMLSSLMNGLIETLPVLIECIAYMIWSIAVELPSIIQPIFDKLPELIITIVDAVVTNLPMIIDGLIFLILEIVRALPDIVSSLVDAIPTVVEMLVASLLENLPTIIGGIAQIIWEIVKALPSLLASLGESFINTFIGIWNGIKSVFTNTDTWFGATFQKASNWVKNAWSSVTGFFTNTKNKIVGAFSNIWDKITSPFRRARDTIKEIADKIKGFFKGEISMPKIKLPHFSLSPLGWKIGDLLKGSIPKLSIKWYAEAMDNPMLLTEPTIFGYSAKTGALQGAGEKGAEVVSGANTLMNMISEAVEGRTAAANEKIISVLLAILDAIMTGNKDTLNALLAGQKLTWNNREVARMVREYA